MNDCGTTCVARRIIGSKPGIFGFDRQVTIAGRKHRGLGIRSQVAVVVDRGGCARGEARIGEGIDRSHKAIGTRVWNIHLSIDAVLPGIVLRQLHGLPNPFESAERRPILRRFQEHTVVAVKAFAGPSKNAT